MMNKMMMNKVFRRLLNDVPLLKYNGMSTLMSLFESNGSFDEKTFIQESSQKHTPFEKYLLEKYDTRPDMEIVDNVAIIPVEGVICRKAGVIEQLLYGYQDIGRIDEMLESALVNKNVEGIILNIDSPGGYSTGVAELSDRIFAANKKKPMVAWTDGDMCSAAYWIASQCSAIICTRSADVGCIGTFMAYADLTEYWKLWGVKWEIIKNEEGTYKGAGVQGTELTADHREFFQDRINKVNSLFMKGVKRSRKQVKDEAMKGQYVIGEYAKDMGLIDGIGTLKQAMDNTLFSLIKTRKNILG